MHLQRDRRSSFLFPVATAALFIAASTASLQAQQFTPIGALSFTKVFNGANPLPQTVTVTSTGTAFNFTRAVSTSSGGSWLSVDNVSFNNCNICATPQNLTVIVNANATLAPGTYAGQIVLTSQNGAITTTIPVSLTVVGSGQPVLDDLPGHVSFSLQTNGLTPPPQPLELRNRGTGTLNWTVTSSTADGGAWLGLSATSGAAPSTVQVSLVKSNLPGQGQTPATFTGKLVFQSATGSITVPVSVVVADNAFRQLNAINFIKPFNGPNPLRQVLAVATTDAPLQFTTSVSTANGGSWLSVDNPSFNNCSICFTSQNIEAIVNASPTLAVGSYTGQIVFTSRDGTQSLTVPVTLTVTPANTPAFDNLPGLVSFSLATNGLTPPDQEVEVRSAPPEPLNWTVTAITSDGGNWLNVSPPSGPAPSSVSVALSVANLPNGGILPGTFVGELIFRSSGQTVTVPVSATVADTVFRQVNALNFTKAVNGANPLPQTITVATTGAPLQFTRAVSTANGGSWLSVDNASFNNCSICSTPQTLKITVNAPPTLAAGTYTGQIVITARDGAQALTVPVTLTVVDQTAGPLFDTLPGQVSFSFQTNGATPPSQTLEIRNAGAGSLSWSVDISTADGGSWLTASPAGGTARSLVTVSIIKQNLPDQGISSGNFVGELVFRSGNQRVTVPVSVVVGAAVFRQVNAISFVKPVSGPDPLAQTLPIQSTGDNFQFTFSASTSSGGAWLTVDNASFNNCSICFTPTMLTARVNASVVLPAGKYTGQIVAISRDGTQTLTVPVTLTVNDTASGPAFDNLPGQVSFSFATGTAAPPDQEIRIRNVGTGTLNWTLQASTSDAGDWLHVSGGSGTAPSTVTVSIVKQNLPNQGQIPGSFSGQLVFRGAGETITVPVTVVVRADVFRQINALSFVKPVGIGANPLPQTITVASTGADFQFTFHVSTANGGNWLSIDNASFDNCSICATPLTLRVIVDAPPTMMPGTYTGQIVITSRDGSQTLTVPVTLTVFNPATGPSFDNIPGQMSFSLTVGTGNPTPRSIEIRNAGSGTLNWSVTQNTADSGSWLTVAPASGSGPGTVSIGVIANALPNHALTPEVFTGEVVFHSAEGDVSVPVSVHVEPNVFVQRPAMHFSALTPGADPPAQTLDITSTGANFQFTVAAKTGAGGNWLSVSTPSNCSICSTPTAITVHVSTAGLALGAYTGQIVVTARNSGQAMTVPVILNIGTPTAMIVSVNPNTGRAGQTLTNVVIAGQNTHFAQGTTIASFGAGTTVNSLTVTSATSATANITIAAGAAAGARIVTLTTGAEVVRLIGGFTITRPPAIVSVNPDTGRAGQTLNVAVTGQNTHFAQGTTIASFGAGTTVNSLTVTSATSATANITIAAGAAAGARIVTLTTGAEVVRLIGGFTITRPPAIVSVNPDTGRAGQTLNVAVTGQNTHFAQGTTIASFGAGTTVNSLTVTNATSATANITIAAGAAAGARIVTLTTGAEVVRLIGGFTITRPPAIVSVNPDTGRAGQTLNVAVTGQNTHFAQGTTIASFGAGTTVNSLTVTNATSATANITIAAGAAAGARIVTLTTGSEVVRLTGGFTITRPPAIVSVNPNTGQAGQTLASVTVTGQNTHFVQGTTTASFGAGITVNSLIVSSATSATANITIRAGAAAGARNVTLTTGSEVVRLTGGFSIVTPLDVVSFNVIYGSQAFEVTAPGVTRLRLSWQIAGMRVVFSPPVAHGNADNPGGVTSAALTGVGANTLT